MSANGILGRMATKAEVPDMLEFPPSLLQDTVDGAVRFFKDHGFVALAPELNPNLDQETDDLLKALMSYVPRYGNYRHDEESGLLSWLRYSLNSNEWVHCKEFREYVH